MIARLAFVAIVTVCLGTAATRRIEKTNDSRAGIATRVTAAALLACAVPVCAFGAFPIGVLTGLVTTVVSAVTDVATGLVFDEVTAIGLTAVIAAAASAGRAQLSGSLAGAFAGLTLLALPHLATRGRGLGLGDVKLGALIGATLGVTGVSQAIGLSFVAGAIRVLPGLLLGHRRLGSRIAFAPYLAAGTIMAALAPWVAP